MKNLINIVIQRLIVHVTDQDQDTFVPSGDLTPLSEDVQAYIEEHLKNALRAPRTHASCFRNPAGDLPAGLCRSMIGSSAIFLSGSATMAQRLLDIIKGKGRITKGNLAFVHFRADKDLGEGDVETFDFLAILKLELGDAFVTVFDEETKVAELKKQGSAVPTNKEGLQKCAFISLERWDGEEGYDMVLLDRQGDDGIARFWEEAFLDAKAALDDIARWKTFKSKGLEVVGKVGERHWLPEATRRSLVYQVHDALNHSQLDARDWAQSLVVDNVEEEVAEQVRQEVENLLIPKLTDAAFCPPPELREKDLIEFRGDKNIVFKIPAQALESLRNDNLIHEEDFIVEGVKHTKFTLITQYWKPK